MTQEPVGFEMTLNYWMTVERYLNLNRGVGGSIPGCEIFSSTWWKHQELNPHEVGSKPYPASRRSLSRVGPTGSNSCRLPDVVYYYYYYDDDESVEFTKWPVEAQDFRNSPIVVEELYNIICLKLIKKNPKITTCNQLDLVTLQILTDHTQMYTPQTLQCT